MEWLTPFRASGNAADGPQLRFSVLFVRLQVGESLRELVALFGRAVAFGVVDQDIDHTVDGKQRDVGVGRVAVVGFFAGADELFGWGSGNFQVGGGARREMRDFADHHCRDLRGGRGEILRFGRPHLDVRMLRPGMDDGFLIGLNGIPAGRKRQAECGLAAVLDNRLRGRLCRQ